MTKKNTQSVVYLVRIGKHVKIGFSTNFSGRLKSFLNSAVDVEPLLTIPSDRPLEKQLHDLLSDDKVGREIFRDGYRIRRFIDHVRADGLEHGISFLEQTFPGRLLAMHREQEEERVRRANKNARQTGNARGDLDAYFASIVADRKRQLGW